MNTLLNEIKKKNATAFTHSGKFHADDVFSSYPIVHALRKKHIPVLTLVEKDGEKLIVRIPSGS